MAILNPPKFFVEESARLFCAQHEALASEANGHVEAAVKIAASRLIETYDHNSFLVRGQTHPTLFYLVDMDERACSCPAFARAVKRGELAFCKHGLAVRFALDACQLKAEFDKDMAEQFQSEIVAARYAEGADREQLA